MIIKGGARAGPGNLASHLEKATNERVTLVAVEGLAATDIRGALREIMALTTGTACRDGMYHASISPEPGEPELTPEQRGHAVEVLAEELHLTGQPRIVVEHEKTGESGIARVHQHIVFGRVDEDGKTISDFNNYPAHERAARRLEIEFGHRETPGVFDRPEGEARPTRTPAHSEWQKAERSGLDPVEARALLTELWQRSDSGKAFVEAAAEHGFTICQGTSCLLVLDEAGDRARLSRRLPDRASDIAERLAEVRDTLPTLEEAQAALALSREARPYEPEPAAALEATPVPDLPSAPVAEPPPPLLKATSDRLPPGEGDLFRDEPPRSGIAADPSDHIIKGVGIVAGMASRIAEQALDVVADINEGLLGFFGGGPIGYEPQPEAERPAERPLSQNQPPPRPTPTELFSEFARARLTGEEMTEVQRRGAELANMKSRDRDMER